MKLEEKLMFLAILNAIDWLLTLHAVNIGATELNPLISEFVNEPLKFTAIKMGAGTGGILAAALFVPRMEPGTLKQVAETLINILLAAYAIIVTSNTIQLVHYYMTH